MKYQAACMVVLLALATVSATSMRRRFLVSEYDQAKAVFDSQGSGVNFDAAVQALIPYIHSDMTVAVCSAACVASAAYVLGPASIFAGVLCPPLCDGALAYLEEQAAQQAG